MKKFDTFTALKNLGFEELKSTIGGTYLTKHYTHTSHDVAWLRGDYVEHFEIEAYFSTDKGTIIVRYYKQGSEFKRKTHLNDKRAFNAIKQTAENNGYEL